MWVSFAPESRLIIDFVLGPRKQYVADESIKITDKRLSDSRPLFVTDGLKFYAETLLKKYGGKREFPETGKRGRPKKPELLTDKDLKYAQVVKKKKEGKLQNVEKRAIFGQNIDQMEILMNLFERQNLTFRQNNNRVSRKIKGFSKKIKGLYYQMRFYCTHFNFCRYYRGLTEEKGDGNSREKTLAQEAGITKMKSTLNELLN